jgi:hypothetical protein
MASITIRASGPRVAAEVWERYARPVSWPSWSPQIRRVECTADRLVAGVTGQVFGPLGVRAAFVVDDWDEPARRWSWTVRLGPARLELEHGVDAASHGCTTWLTARGALPIVVGYAPVARLALHRLVN